MFSPFVLQLYIGGNDAVLKFFGGSGLAADAETITPGDGSVAVHYRA
jgi:hypothetical protein